MAVIFLVPTQLHEYKSLFCRRIACYISSICYKTNINKTVAEPEGYLIGHKDGQIGNRNDR